MSGEILKLTQARHELRRMVLHALVAEDAYESFTAWEQVDLAAERLVNARKQYKKHVRQVVKNLNVPRSNSE